MGRLLLKVLLVPFVFLLAIITLPFSIPNMLRIRKLKKEYGLDGDEEGFTHLSDEEIDAQYPDRPDIAKRLKDFKHGHL